MTPWLSLSVGDQHTPKRADTKTNAVVSSFWGWGTLAGLIRGQKGITFNNCERTISEMSFQLVWSALLDCWHQRETCLCSTLDFIIYIINEPKLHLSCSLADLVTVSHLQCVALLYWGNRSTYKLQEILSGQLEQWQTSSKQNASLKKCALYNFWGGR